MDSRLVLPFNTVLAEDYRIRRVVGSGGFGITYEAEDINLGTVVAIKEYYPLDFGERGATMSVMPKSERHKPTFERGRSSFLQEARTLARFEHPSIVRVTRVFEWNSNAYMVMRFEHGVSLEAWLRSLGRPPTQAELDTILAPLLGALEMMHAANFLHRDIAPDNIIVRADGSPVLLDFGAARRTVAEMSRSLTGIVKAGYSPHEQYSSDGRLQGPWSDLYALGATLYRAVAGKAPEDAVLRVDEDQMASAAQAAKGQYRRDFLAAIDSCLKVRHTERPRSVAQLRPMLLTSAPRAKAAEPMLEPRSAHSPTVPVPPQTTAPRESRRGAWRWVAAAALVAIIGGAYGGLEYQRRHGGENGAGAPLVTSSIEAEVARDRKRQADLEVERRQKEREAADARQRQTALEEERRRKAEADAETARSEQARVAALQDEQRRAEEARRKAEADAETRRKEEQRVAALEEERRSEERRKEAERVRLAAIPGDDQRAELVRKVQQLLKRGGCYAGALTGRSNDAQEAADRFVENVRSRGKAKPQGIKLAKANVGDFESWLRDAESVTGTVCAAKPKPEQQEKPQRPRETPQAQAGAKSPGNDRPGHGGSCSNWMFYNTSCVDAGGRTCRQTTAGRRCD